MLTDLPSGSFILPSAFPRGLRVAVYGTGSAGGFAREVLERERDCTVPFFVDSFRDGEAHGLPVVRADRLSRRIDEVDTVYIAAYAWFEIEPVLQKLAVPHYLIGHAEGASGGYYTDEEAADLRPDFLRARDMLEDRDSRELYGHLFEARRRRDARGLQQAVARAGGLLRPLSRQYLDHINPAAVRCIVEGGVFDGQSTESFLRFLPDDGRIYGFDPFTDHASQVDPRLTVIPKALWDRECTLYMTVTSGGALVGETAREGADCRPVPAVSIDAFAGETPVDFIKLDIEGGETRALLGAAATISRDRPQLAVSIYHSKQDFIRLPLLIGELLPDCAHFLGHYTRNIHETIWYAVPREKLPRP